MRTEGTPDTYIVDIPQRVRRCISSNPNSRDKKIEDRVIENAGDLAFNFAHTFFDAGSVGTDRVEKDTVNDKIDFQRIDLWTHLGLNIKGIGLMMKSLIEERGPGLINNFRLTEPFIAAAATSRQKGYGYWAFLGNSVDDEGEFVRLPVHEKHKKCKAALHDKARKERDDARAELQNLRQYFPHNNANEAQTGDRSNGNDSSTTTKGKEGKRTEKHSMVLLGGKSRRVWDKTQWKFVSKQHFLCLNSWHQMPLVLVSLEYLEACGAQALFRNRAMTKEQKLDFAVNENCLAVGMASPRSNSEDQVNDCVYRYMMNMKNLHVPAALKMKETIDSIEPSTFSL